MPPPANVRAFAVATETMIVEVDTFSVNPVELTLQTVPTKFMIIVHVPDPILSVRVSVPVDVNDHIEILKLFAVRVPDTRDKLAPIVQLSCTV